MTHPIPVKGKGGIGPATALTYSANRTRSMPAKYRAEPEIFGFERQHLKNWLMDDDVWAQLPEDMYLALTRTQHAGAAVVTCLSRLEQLAKSLPKDEDVTTKATSLADATATDAITAKLEEHAAVIAARPNRPQQMGDVHNCSPFPTTRMRGRSGYIDSFGSSRSPLSSGTNSTGYMSPTARVSPPSVLSPAGQPEVFHFSPAMTPFELGESNLPTISRRESEVLLNKASLVRKDSEVSNISLEGTGLGSTTSSVHSRGSKAIKVKAPKDWKSTRYYGELEQLRQRELVRLRHSTRPVRLLWSELKCEPSFVMKAKQCAKFEEYWKETERKIAALDTYVKGLCEGIHFSLGWADMPGLDQKYNPFATTV